ncbi:NAD(P)-binding domain containing protein [Trema orientale]|uniref:NAD(P)-binding domain containing protein n=1 Tax=Trema orientale TaxID=63057 RepID=A0A2P5ESY5_TREOI|nr:NAD(P)-binding domain containing protein [Trema orientale]
MRPSEALGSLLPIELSATKRFTSRLIEILTVPGKERSLVTSTNIPTLKMFILRRITPRLESHHTLSTFCFEINLAATLECAAISNEKVTEIVILALNHGAAAKIKRFQLDALDDREVVRKAKLVITATNAEKPVLETDEIALNAVIISLGKDELPAAYFNRLLTVDSLIIEHGRDHGIKNSTDVLADPALMEELKTWEGPANFSSVSLASLDLAVASRVYKTLPPQQRGLLRIAPFRRCVSPITTDKSLNLAQGLDRRFSRFPDSLRRSHRHAFSQIIELARTAQLISQAFIKSLIINLLHSHLHFCAKIFPVSAIGI